MSSIEEIYSESDQFITILRYGGDLIIILDKADDIKYFISKYETTTTFKKFEIMSSKANKKKIIIVNNNYNHSKFRDIV